MSTIVQPGTILQKLEEFCDKYPTFIKAAKALGITSAQLSMTRNGKTNVIPERVLKKLGYASKLVYVAADSKKAPKPKTGGTPKAKPATKAKPVRKADIANKKIKITEKPGEHRVPLGTHVISIRD